MSSYYADIAAQNDALLATAEAQFAANQLTIQHKKRGQIYFYDFRGRP